MIGNITETEEEKKLRLEKVLQDNRFDYQNPPKEGEGLISILQGNEELSILNRQGLLAVFGKTGVRKSTFLTIIGTAAYTKQKVGRISTNISGDIVWFDTEQSGIEFYNLQRKMHDMCDLSDNTHRIKSYSLVELSNLQDRLDAIELAMQKSDNVGLLIVDGIKDLLLDSNDESTSKQVIEILRSYTVKYDCGLVTVLHTDKLGTHMVGRLGTLLGEKASYTLKLELAGGTGETIVSGDKTRGKKFSPFRINHDEYGNVIFKDENTSVMDSSVPEEDDEGYKFDENQEAIELDGIDLKQEPVKDDDVPF